MTGKEIYKRFTSQYAKFLHAVLGVLKVDNIGAPTASLIHL